MQRSVADPTERLAPPALVGLAKGIAGFSSKVAPVSRILLFTVMLAVLLAHLLVPAYASAAGCRFVLGFATLKALIDEAEGT